MAASDLTKGPSRARCYAHHPRRHGGRWRRRRGPTHRPTCHRPNRSLLRRGDRPAEHPGFPFCSRTRMPVFTRSTHGRFRAASSGWHGLKARLCDRQAKERPCDPSTLWCRPRRQSVARRIRWPLVPAGGAPGLPPSGAVDRRHLTANKPVSGRAAARALAPAPSAWERIGDEPRPRHNGRRRHWTRVQPLTEQ
jgi:hypothetical protein